MLYNNTSSTKTDATKQRYTKQADQLWRRYNKEEASNPCHADFVRWLIELKPSITPSTWRSYKSSVVWYLTSHSRQDLAEALLVHSSENCAPRVSNNRRTSGKKKKSVTEREERLICTHLENSADSSFWSIRAAAFFRATLLVGLRPIEWQGAELIFHPSDGVTGPFPILRVKNAKATNGRAHGEYRHLHLHQLSEDDVKRIWVAVLFADASNPKGLLTPSGKADDWEDFYNRLRQYFAKVVQQVFPYSKRGISLYSCRHQFIADLKLAGYSLTEIAALVGHAVDETAAVHYGRKRNGRSGQSGLPVANADEVARIRTNISTAQSPKSPTPS